MANLIRGMEILVALADLLNDICRKEGGIRRNDPRIWEDYLHKLTEDEWQDIITALNHIHQTSPGCVLPQDAGVLIAAQDALTKACLLGKSFVGKPNVTKSGNKKLAWQVTMTLREVANRVNGTHVPNRPGNIEDVQDLPQPTTTFNEVFSEQ